MKTLNKKEAARRRTEAAFWLRVAESESGPKPRKGLCVCVYLAYAIGRPSKARYELRNARYAAIRLFHPDEQKAAGTHNRAYYWPCDAREERGYYEIGGTGRFDKAKMRDRVLAALLLSAMAKTGDI